jgi:hypothetical protein
MGQLYFGYGTVYEPPMRHPIPAIERKEPTTGLPSLTITRS